MSHIASETPARHIRNIILARCCNKTKATRLLDGGSGAAVSAVFSVRYDLL